MLVFLFLNLIVECGNAWEWLSRNLLSSIIMNVHALRSCRIKPNPKCVYNCLNLDMCRNGRMVRYPDGKSRKRKLCLIEKEVGRSAWRAVDRVRLNDDFDFFQKNCKWMIVIWLYVGCISWINYGNITFLKAIILIFCGSFSEFSS
jgi:hypothetical protein